MFQVILIIKGSESFMLIKDKDTNEFRDNYYTHNRKLKLEEYDDNGNIIDVIELKQSDLWNFYMLKNNNYIDLAIARKKDREYFKGKQLELVKRMIDLIDEQYFNENTVKYIEDIFKTYTIEQIEFALNFKDYFYNQIEVFLSMDDYNQIKQMKFIDVLKWVKDSEGIYYAVSNDGRKGMMYLERPTKKQAKYQRQKNGKRIIFFSFKDWTEHLVNEVELH